VKLNASRRVGLMAALAPLVLLSWSLVAQAQTESPNRCGPLNGMHYGPYDYRTEKGRLRIVDVAHFTPAVESLIRGSTGVLGKDLDYVLKASPNHHRAIASIVKWSRRLNRIQLPDMDYDVGCYFDRAIRFAPNDFIVRSMFAEFAGRRGDKVTARRQLEYVLDQAADNPLSLHNAGLVAAEVSLDDLALSAAHKALALGFVNSPLEQRLRQSGKWQDTPPAPPAAPASAASAVPS